MKIADDAKQKSFSQYLEANGLQVAAVASMVRDGIRWEVRDPSVTVQVILLEDYLKDGD